MNLRKKISGAALGLSLAVFASLSLAGPASASNESATIGLKMDPLKGSLYKEAFAPVNWQVETKIITADPQILPMKRANLSLPGRELTFNPAPGMPICTDENLNANNVSVTIPEMVQRCPDSIIGNGTAKFALAQSSANILDGVMIVFNGGKVNGLSKIKVYAYSYDTGVGVYTESVLEKDGSLDFAIPQLTADSSVTSLNLSIPGKPTDLFVASKNITVTIPAGQDPNYAKAKCGSGSWNYGAEFLLGKRDTSGQDYGPTTVLNEQSVTPCTGKAGKAKFGGLKIKGPKSVKKGKKGTFKVKVKNNGTATAKKGKIVVKGKGVKGKASFGNLAPGKTKTVKVKVKFTKKGKVKATFKATAKSTKAKTGKKVVKVK